MMTDAFPQFVTVTLNPAIDQTLFVDRFVPGRVNRASQEFRQAGGKGINVSAMLADYGISSRATGFLGRENDALFAELFETRGIQDGLIRISGETRTGIKIIDGSSGETTDINLAGLEPTCADLEQLKGSMDAQTSDGRWFVIAGSLPKGIDVGFFRELVGLLMEGGGKVAVDGSGAVLRAAIDAGVDLIKPNEHELGEYLGVELRDLDEKIAAAREIQKTRVPHVILSLGGEGALFVSPESSLIASAPPVDVISTVGAGDSLLAGYLAGLGTGRSTVERAELATVFAWSALERLDRRLPSRTEIEQRMSRISVREIS